MSDYIEKILRDLPKFSPDYLFKERLKERIMSEYRYKQQKSLTILPLFRFAPVLAIIAIFIGTVFVSKNLFKPKMVSAVEIIKRNVTKFLLPNTIYHEKTKMYQGGGDIPIVYEFWKDQESSRFYNEVIYQDGGRVVQGFNQEFWFEIDYKNKTIRKDIYIYEKGESSQPLAEMVDIAKKFDELIKNGILEAKEEKLGERDVYVVYDRRTTEDKYWDILTFDKRTFQLLKTEKYGEDKSLETLVEYEIQEAIERTPENLQRIFSYKDPGAEGFILYQRNFYPNREEQEDYVIITGSPSAIGVTPTPTLLPLELSPTEILVSPSATPQNENLEEEKL